MRLCCSYSASADCNSYDGPYSYPQCWLATGGGEIDSSSCPAGVAPTTDGFTHDYTCREEGSSAKCVDTGRLAVLCGDNLAAGSVDEEPCDGTDLRGKTCQSEGFSGGTLKCGSTCTSFDTSGCFKCGDGNCESLKGETKDNCAADCSKCGNGVVDAGEQCDSGSAATKMRQVSWE